MKNFCLIICLLSIKTICFSQNTSMQVNTFNTPLYTLFSPMSFQKNSVTPAGDTVPKITKNVIGNILYITQQSNCEGVAATFTNKFNPSKDWQLSFIYTLNSAGGSTLNADGIAVSIHNDARGTAAVGGSGISLGCEGASGYKLLCNDQTSTAIKSSVDWELKIYGLTAPANAGLIRISNATIPVITSVGANSLPAGMLASNIPINITLRYTASTNSLVTTMSNSSGVSTIYSYSINMNTYVGTSAYLAFTGGTGALTSSQSITRVFMLGSQ